MKKLTFLITIIAVVAIGVLGLFSVYASTNQDPEKDKTAKFENIKKRYGIEAVEDTKSSKIAREKAIEIAKKFCRESPDTAKKIKTYKSIITDKSIKTVGFSKSALDANPKLKEKDYVSEIPVWIITFEGVNSVGLHGAVFADDNVFIDSDTGEYLFGFR